MSYLRFFKSSIPEDSSIVWFRLLGLAGCAGLLGFWHHQRTLKRVASDDSLRSVLSASETSSNASPNASPRRVSDVRVNGEPSELMLAIQRQDMRGVYDVLKNDEYVKSESERVEINKLLNQPAMFVLLASFIQGDETPRTMNFFVQHKVAKILSIKSRLQKHSETPLDSKHGALIELSEALIAYLRKYPTPHSAIRIQMLLEIPAIAARDHPCDAGESASSYNL
jgi:hypothetical protein